jgi:hypothetical protein
MSATETIVELGPFTAGEGEPPGEAFGPRALRPPRE